MSAESPRRIAQKESTGHVVLPQPVNDPSLIDSVAGFIQDVVPQVYLNYLCSLQLVHTSILDK